MLNRPPSIPERVLAIDPFSRGFGFVVLEGTDSLVDWGLKDIRKAKAEKSLKQIAILIAHYEPGSQTVDE